MKCTKCGYISFDYNQVCPKCNKDISAQQGTMNLPSFRPEPPYLLGALTGEADEAEVGFSGDSPSMDDSHELDVDLDDSTALDTGEGSLDEEQDLDISFEDEEEVTLEGSGEIELTDETEIGPEESVSDFDLEGGEEDISLDMDDVFLDDSEGDLPSTETGGEDDELSLDLGEVSFDDTGEEEEPEPEISLDQGEEDEIELGDFSLDEDGTEEEPETVISLDQGEGDEIELNLDDLKLNETGELEIGTEGEDSREGDGTSEIGVISLDDSASEEGPPGEAQGEDKGIEIDLEEVSLDDLGGSEAPDSSEEELSLDLDDLDLDIDLEEPDK